jgi:hypothetical protein
VPSGLLNQIEVGIKLIQRADVNALSSENAYFLGDFRMLLQAVKNEEIVDAGESGRDTRISAVFVLCSLEVSRFRACFVRGSCFHRAFSHEANT